jgi:hypothetical protein
MSIPSKVGVVEMNNPNNDCSFLYPMGFVHLGFGTFKNIECEAPERPIEAFLLFVRTILHFSGGCRMR